MKDVLLLLGLIVGWYIILIFQAIKEAHLWNLNAKAKSEDQIDGEVNEILHGAFLAERVVIGSPYITILILNDLHVISICLFGICMIITSPFIHNGLYYEFRNFLNNKVYPKKFKDHSTTSKAKMTKFLDWENRYRMFLIGWIIMVFIGVWEFIF